MDGGPCIFYASRCIRERPEQLMGTARTIDGDGPEIDGDGPEIVGDSPDGSAIVRDGPVGAVCKQAKIF